MRSEWVVLLHVAVSFWFVAGLLGRNVTMARARSANDLSTLVELVEHVDLSGRFERLMVIPGSFGVVVAGLLAAWANGPRSAIPRFATRATEIVAVAIIVTLMVTKPF